MVAAATGSLAGFAFRQTTDDVQLPLSMNTATVYGQHFVRVFRTASTASVTDAVDAAR